LNCLWRCFFIKIKVKGYLQNVTENTKEIIDTFGIKNKDTISYILNDTKYKITISNNKILLIRDNQEFLHKIEFELNKEKETEYYIKELSTSIYLFIQTTYLSINKNLIEIHYKVIDSQEEYIYLIEMSDR